MEIYVVQFLKNQRSIVCLQLISVIISFASTNVAAQTNEPTLSRTNVEELSILESGPADNTTTAGKSNDNIADSVVFQAPRDTPHRFFTFTFQNDVFLNRDFGYTNGTGLTFGKGPFLSFNGNVSPLVDKLSRKLYIRTMPNKIHGIAHMFFQRMQTPRDFTVSSAQPDDLPYVGILAVQTTLYAYDKKQSDQFSTYLGLVGPASLAKEAQTLVHSITGSDKPEGWNNQIENEPLFKFEALRMKKLYRNYYSENRGLDLVGIGQLGIGTLSSEALLFGILHYLI